jgi:hypothetical protein
LPRALGDRAPGLRRVDVGQPPTREIWLLVHADWRRLAHIAAVVARLERTLRRLEADAR